MSQPFMFNLEMMDFYPIWV